MVEGLGSSTFWRKRSAMAGVGFLKSLWKMPGVWPYLDPMDSVCLRAREVWAARRALFLFDPKGTGDGAGL